MAYEQKDMSGALFRADKKGNEKKPDMQGQAMIEGTAYWVSGWANVTKDGAKWLKLAFKRKDAAAEARPHAATERPVDTAAGGNESLPF